MLGGPYNKDHSRLGSKVSTENVEILEKLPAASSFWAKRMFAAASPTFDSS